MLKFFRNIRKNLIGEGKTTKYFKYAIGEIVLVVIGILIALQINNWNQVQNEKIVESGYMQNLLEDLNEDIGLYEDIEQKNLVIYQLIDSIIPNLKHKDRKANMDNLSFWVRSVTLEWQFIHPVTRSFEQMKSSGHLRLIKNEEVANAISNYYSSLSEFDGYNEASMLWAAEYVKAIGKIFDGELMLKIMRERKKQTSKPSDLLTEDPIVINELINSLQYFNGAIFLGESVSKRQKEKAETLVKLIETNYRLK
jgi:hypothetical protein